MGASAPDEVIWEAKVASAAVAFLAPLQQLFHCKSAALLRDLKTMGAVRTIRKRENCLPFIIREHYSNKTFLMSLSKGGTTGYKMLTLQSKHSFIWFIWLLAVITGMTLFVSHIHASALIILWIYIGFLCLIPSKMFSLKKLTKKVYGTCWVIFFRGLQCSMVFSSNSRCSQQLYFTWSMDLTVIFMWGSHLRLSCQQPLCLQLLFVTQLAS